MNIIAFIPARSGSKSIADKNIKDLGGKPLLAWSTEAALSCGLRTYVSTDSVEYGEIAKQYGAEVLLRPAHLAKDETAMYDLLKSEVPKTNADLVVLLQPTSPFRKKLHIKLAIQYLEQNEQFDSVVVVERVPERYNPYAMFINTNAGKKVLLRKLIGWKEKLTAYFTGRKYVAGEFPIGQRLTRRQDVEAWMPSGELYVFRSKNLKGGSLYGDKVLMIESEGSANINTLEDFEKAEKYLHEKTYPTT